ncbi:MAG TPA: hypothetical protein VI790_04410 [Candidatus Nanoarchaeia archaeon]|nr:hypothetical protein [Candidatus Nanoarchaeia archaeon]
MNCQICDLVELILKEPSKQDIGVIIFNNKELAITEYTFRNGTKQKVAWLDDQNIFIYDEKTKHIIGIPKKHEGLSAMDNTQLNTITEMITAEYGTKVFRPGKWIDTKTVEHYQVHLK